MIRTQHLSFAALGTAILVGLGGCALIEPVGTERVLTSIESCALGKTWNLDVADLATQVQAEQAAQGRATEVVGEGTQTLDWTLEGDVEIDSNYTLTVTWTPAADQVNVITENHAGTAGGVAYISGEVAIPRNWDGTGLTVSTTATLNDAPLDPVPFTTGVVDVDDSVGLELTCDAGTMTIHPRGGTYTLRWTS